MLALGLRAVIEAGGTLLPFLLQLLADLRALALTGWQLVLGLSNNVIATKGTQARSEDRASGRLTVP
jgi:hypothetical protein